MTATTDRPASGPQPGSRPGWRAVGVPTEHGGWGLTLEPVVLGLLVAPSWSGVLLGVAAFAAFVVRTPVRVVLVDHFRHRRLARTSVAARLAVVELAVLGTLVVGAWLLAAAPFWLPLIAAVPLVGLELWFDMRSRSRRLVPELAGAIGIGSVASAIVLADGASGEMAAGVWLVVAARAVASLPFVRVQLQRFKRQPHRTGPVLACQAVAVAGVATGAAAGWLPGPAVAAVAALAVIQIVLLRVRPPRAAVLGATQILLGLAVVVTAGLAMAP